jgi:hypothetical protein
MDLSMVKQEQGETLRKYMRRFFDKCATVVDVTDKEVIDLFQGGLHHRRTFEDFGRHRPRSIPHLKDMITSWADEEDKANAKYDAIRDKNKQNTGGGSGNNGNQGGRNNKTYSGPNRKRKPDNTVAAIQLPAKETSKKNSGGFKDLLKEKCPWHPNGNHTTEQCYQLRHALKDTQRHCTLTTRRARRRPTETTTTSRNPIRLSTSSSADYPTGGSRRLPVEKSRALNQRFRPLSGGRRYPLPSPARINGPASLNQDGSLSS